MSFIEVTFAGDTKALQIRDNSVEAENQDFVLLDKILSEIEAEYFSNEQYRNDIAYLDSVIQY